MNTKSAVQILSLVVLLVGTIACKGPRPSMSRPILPPRPKPAPPKPLLPTAELRVEPTSIERGQTAALRWTSQHAEEALLEPDIGEVALQGQREVTAFSDTTYELTVWGPGGEARATARLEVSPPRPPAVKRTSEEEKRIFRDVVSTIDDVLFDYDASTIRDDAALTLRNNAAALRDLFRDIPFGRVRIEGHCDERGTSEYNLALGDRRSRAVFDHLVGLGLPAKRFAPVSFGKEKPQCYEPNETFWRRNRRAHFEPVFD